MKNKKQFKFLVLLVALFCFYALASHIAYSMYREKIDDSIDLSILDPSATFLVTFDVNTGDPLQDNTRTKAYNQPIGELPTATKTGFNFIGWYTDPDEDEGVKISAGTLVTGNVTYYAHWEKIICKKAVTGTLHTETCDSSGSCHVKGLYSANAPITYGTIPNTYSPKVGDAYDCDVNDDGTFDALTERFYYVREITDSSGSEDVKNSFLVHFTSFDENGQMDSSKTRGSYVYDTAINYLPTASTWDNSGLISMNGNVTRFINREDLNQACGSNSGGNSFATCQFFLEHSRFQSGDLGRAGIWLEKENNTLYRIHTESLTATTAPDSASVNSARPVIQIPSFAIEGYKIKELYHVDFDEKGGSSVTDFDRYEGEELGTLETPTKSGYVFDGWYTDDEDYTTQVTASTIVTGDATYYAKWLEELTINFNANGTGASVSPTFKKVGKGKAIGELPTPTYTGREFSGWFTDPTNGTEVTASTIMNASTTLYAHWTGDDELSYVFYIPGECTFTATGLTNGSNGDCISTINPTGSNIDYTQSSLSSKRYIDTGIALYDSTNHGKDYEIGFTIVSYTSSTQNDKATLMNTKAEVSTNDLKYPGITFRRNNTTDNFLLQSRQTLSTNAEYTVASSTVQDVKIYRIDDEIYYSINDAPKVLLNNLESYNPVFDLNVWFGAAPTNASASAAQRFFKGTLSDMYIKLDEDLVQVTFDPNYEGAQTTTQNVVKGSAIGELDEPDDRVGYTFLGWFTEPSGGTEITSSTIVNDTDTYYAHWAQNVTISLIPGQDATVTPNTITLPSGTTIGNRLPTPEKTGYTFLGWFTDPTGGTEITSSTVVNSGDTYYAHWVQDVTISLIPGQDATVTPNTVTLAPGSTIGNKLPTPEKTGYTFLGWFTDPTAGTEITSSTVVNSDDTYYAHWVKNVTVTFNADGGTASFNSKEVEPGTAIGELPTATKENNIFDGWYDENDTSYTTQITAETIVNTDVTYKAKWVAANYVAEVNGQGYTTLAEAIAAVPTTGVKTTVTILKDITVTEATTIPSNKWVELDIGTYTISTNTGNYSLFINRGKLDISNGTLYSSAGYIIENIAGSILNISGGTLTYDNSNQTEYKVAEIKGGTVNITGGLLTCNSKAAVINVKDGILNVSAGQIKGSNTFKGQAIYNDGGTTNISGTAYLENVSQSGSQNGRSCVTNNSGTVNITGGTIVSKNNAAAKNNGTMTIGSDDGTINITSPVLQGNTYGLETVSGKPVTIYDGIFKGGAGSNPAKAISNEAYTSHGTAVITHDTETIAGVTYDVAYLVDTSVNYTVTFNPNSGTIKTGDPNTKTYTEVGTVGQMPSASKTDTEFLGWFTAATGGEKVLTTTVVDADVTYYAHYTSQVTVCRPATTLHSSSGTDFGQIPSGGNISAGDAFDCDVNGDGTYDATTERFYYLEDSNEGNAVFIYYNNTSQAGSNNGAPKCDASAIAYGSNGPTTAIEELPTTSQWTNVSLYSEPRSISNGNVTLSSDFAYTGKAARFATLDEIKAATTSTLNGTTNELDSYPFLIENTKTYTSSCRSNYWMETPSSATNVYRIDGNTSNGKKLGNVNTSTGNSGVRPVIEVPYSSIDGVVNIVEFDTIPDAMRVYFNNVATWNAGQDDSNYSSFNSSMTTNLNNYDCAYYLNDNTGTQYGSVFCDQPKKYDTGVTGNVNVYEYDEVNGTTSNTLASYVSNDNGKLYNFIPGKTYYWVSASDSTKNGYVRPTGERRLITIPGTTRMTRNVRDLGGLPVDTNGDGVIDGKTKFGKLYRGEKIWGTNRNGVTRGQFEALGIYNEFDLRTQGSEIVASEEDQLTNYFPYEIVHYKIDHTEFGSPATEPRFNGKSYYQLARDAAIDVMKKVVAGNDDYAIFFHCRVGADRTGTLAYILEGLLGVPTEYRHQDYELTTFFGLRERTRYYLKKDSTNDSYKFIYLKKAIRHATPNNNEITGEENVMDWFLLEGNSTNECSDITALISQFRAKMIDYNS